MIQIGIVSALLRVFVLLIWQVNAFVRLLFAVLLIFFLSEIYPLTSVLMCIKFFLTLLVAIFIAWDLPLFLLSLIPNIRVNDDSVNELFGRFYNQYKIRTGPLFIFPYGHFSPCFIPTSLRIFIVTKGVWNALEPEERLFVVGHELGHLYLLLREFKLVFSSDTISQHKVEFLSDEIGLKLTGNLQPAVTALEKTCQLFPAKGSNKPNTHPTILERIQVLQSKTAPKIIISERS